VRGVANQLDTLLDSFLSSNGLLTNRTESLNDELADIEQERVDLNARLVLSEDRLRASFLANDLIISNLNTTSDFLSSQLKLLEGLVSSRTSDD
jgi:flagellar hook-associated protein 2